jgi:hypothetical protein
MFFNNLRFTLVQSSGHAAQLGGAFDPEVAMAALVKPLANAWKTVIHKRGLDALVVAKSDQHGGTVQ